MSMCTGAAVLPDWERVQMRDKFSFAEEGTRLIVIKVPISLPLVPAQRGIYILRKEYDVRIGAANEVIVERARKDEMLEHLKRYGRAHADGALSRRCEYIVRAPRTEDLLPRPRIGHVCPCPAVANEHE